MNNDDLLSKLAPKAEQTLDNPNNPYKQLDTKATTIRIRNSTYEKLRKVSFINKIKITDLATELIEKGLKDSEYQE